VSFDDRLRHTLVVRRLVAATGGAGETAGGVDTTLTADTAAGATSVSVADATGIAEGDWLRIGDAGETEIRQVAPGGVAGLVVTLTAELAAAHDSGDQVRQVDDAGTPTLDDYGQPVTVATTVATVAGLIQPRAAREVALASQAGAAIGEYVGYLRPLAGLTTHDWIELGSPADMAGRYDILSVPDAAGLEHHLELGLRRIA
jgi:hypothetical protein